MRSAESNLVLAPLTNRLIAPSWSQQGRTDPAHIDFWLVTVGG
jgi:hypothetical protein